MSEYVRAALVSNHLHAVHLDSIRLLLNLIELLPTHLHSTSSFEVDHHHHHYRILSLSLSSFWRFIIYSHIIHLASIESKLSLTLSKYGNVERIVRMIFVLLVMSEIESS